MLKNFMEVQGWDRINVQHFIVIEVQSRDISKVKIPEGCVRVRFLDKEETLVNGHSVFGHPKNFSGWYYRGTEFSLEEAKEKISPEQYRKLRLDGHKRIVITKKGKVFGLNKEDTVIPA